MTSHRFETDPQGHRCAVMTDGEPCGLTDAQHEQILKEADCRARKLLAAVRKLSGAGSPPREAYEHAREQIEAALWIGVNAGRVWSRRSAA